MKLEDELQVGLPDTSGHGQSSVVPPCAGCGAGHSPAQPWLDICHNQCHTWKALRSSHGMAQVSSSHCTVHGTERWRVMCKQGRRSRQPHTEAGSMGRGTRPQPAARRPGAGRCKTPCASPLPSQPHQHHAHGEAVGGGGGGSTRQHFRRLQVVCHTVCTETPRLSRLVAPEPAGSAQSS